MSAMISRPHPGDADHDPDDPWMEILQSHTCADCGWEIPAHLAERWSGITYEEAQTEWREVYKGKN